MDRFLRIFNVHGVYIENRPRSSEISITSVPGVKVINSESSVISQSSVNSVLNAKMPGRMFSFGDITVFSTLTLAKYNSFIKISASLMTDHIFQI